jgi:alpha-1,6-mannosyltransferase
MSRKRLFALGLASGLVYLLAFTLPYWLPTYYLNVKDEIYALAARQPWRGVLFYVALAVLFGLYLAAYRLVTRHQAGQTGAWLVGLWTLIFCLLLIPIHPLTSSDVFGYIFQGRIVAIWGQNPFAHVYNEFAADPFYFLVTFHNLPATTGYGPLWIAVEAALGWLARGQLLLNLFLFKGLAAGLHLAATALVYRALKRRAPDHALGGMLFYAWNPLLLFELVGNAHNDAAVAALALLGFYLLSRRRWWAAVPCLAGAALVKPVALLWLPLAGIWVLARLDTWGQRLGRAAALAALTVLPAVAAYAPFWVGTATFNGLLAQSNIHDNSLPNLLIVALGSIWPPAQYQIVQGVKLAAALLFAPFYLARLFVARRDLPRAAFDVMLFYLLFVGLQFMPWYVTWLLVPAALAVDALRRRLAVLLCLGAPLLYLPFGWQWAREHLPLWALAFVAAMPLLVLSLWLGGRTWQRLRSA